MRKKQYVKTPGVLLITRSWARLAKTLGFSPSTPAPRSPKSGQRNILNQVTFGSSSVKEQALPGHFPVGICKGEQAPQIEIWEDTLCHVCERLVACSQRSLDPAACFIVEISCSVQFCRGRPIRRTNTDVFGSKLSF